MELWTFENLIRTYKYIAVFSTIFFIIKFVIFSFVGGDSEVSGDFDAITDVDTSFDFWSVQSVLAFLMGFGWIGLAALLQWNLTVKLTIVLSIGVGMIFMFISAYLMFKIKSLNHIVKEDLSTCLNKTGKAYTNINAHSEGQIEIEYNEKLTIKNAINSTEVEIKAFEPIKVVKIEQETLYIEKI